MRNAENKEQARLRRLQQLHGAEAAPQGLLAKLMHSMRHGQGSLVLLTMVAIFGMSSSYRALQTQRDMEGLKVEHEVQVADLRRGLEKHELQRKDVLAALKAFEAGGTDKAFVQTVKQTYGLVPKAAPSDSFKGVI